MKQSVYLHRQIVDILRCYGTLDEVVNRILQEAANGNFDPMHKPPCPGRDGAGRYDIDVTEPSYLELLSVYGPFSSKISLRRMIYWFVENEMYEEFGWEPVNEYCDMNKRTLNTKLSNALTELEKAKRYSSEFVIEQLSQLCNEIKTLQEYLKNGI